MNIQRRLASALAVIPHRPGRLSFLLQILAFKVFSFPCYQSSAMELVTSVLGSLLADVGRHLYGFISSGIRNSRLYFNDLEKEMKLLTDLRNNVEMEGELVTTIEATEWLKQVEGIEHEVSLIQEAVAANHEKCCGGFLNCCLHRRQLEKGFKEVKRLEEEGISLLAANRIPKSAEYIPTAPIEDQATATQNLAKIMNLLNDDGVRRIGVWGMGGVGKTTLIKNLNNKLRNASSAQPFSIVIWVTVSQELDLIKIQTQIAERLDLGLIMNGSNRTVAGRLFQRLEQEKFLLILDDVWEGIDLDALGVPQPEVHAGCKIILTSRRFDVCREMKTDIEVKMDVLNHEEAWKLFCQNAGEVATLKHIKPLAAGVAGECGGLPLAIIIMGTSMRGKTRVELWKDALNELRRSVPYNIEGIEDKVYKPLKWSYDSLQGESIKSCFLYCSLFPEDFSIQISELVQCWLAEGFINEQQNYEDVKNRGIALIENLKDCCLLEHGDHKDTVKMHDVVRDVAKWIASTLEDGSKSLVESGVGLGQVSELELSKPLKRVSFMFNKITRLPEHAIGYSGASTLLLQGNLPLQEVPEGFLLGFQALRVLNMSGTQIQRLPSSILQLAQLRALLLKGCLRLVELPPLGRLCRLQVLDCSATLINELPEGMEQLKKLRELNLSRTIHLKTIQAEVIAGLSSLEVLDMTDSEYKWGVKGKVEEGRASFEELECLEKLIDLSIRLESTSCPALEDVNWMNKLNRFLFHMGSTTHEIHKETEHDGRQVILRGLDLSGKQIGWSIIKASSLLLDRCKGLDHLLEAITIKSMKSAVGCFSCLKALTIMNSGSRLRPTGGYGARCDLLPNLEEIHLCGLTRLVTISELTSQLGLRFSKLRVMEVTWCPKLKYLLSYGGFIRTLKNLEEIKVRSCNNLDELFIPSSRWTSASEPVFPKLRVMELDNLPKLTSLFREESLPQLEKLVVTECSLLKKLPLTLQSASSMKEIKGEVEWWNELEWADDAIRLSLQHHFNS